MKTNVIAAVIASGLLACSGAHALTADQHKAAKAKIEADYKSQKVQCDTLKANAKDVCEEEAEAKENIAKAELEHQYKPSPAHARKVAEAKAEGAHDVAKEKCDDQTGDAKNACEKQAKADYDKAKADIKATKF
jgi:septal ring factor EnvC (AmiA/AmiB activator)